MTPDAWHLLRALAGVAVVIGVVAGLAWHEPPPEENGSLYRGNEGEEP